MRYFPSRYCGTYRIPARPFDLLEARLRRCRNRRSAHELAAFVLRMQCGPNTYGRAFPLDRRALTGHAVLGELTEGRLRGAIAKLEEIGLVERIKAEGSPYKRRGEGGGVRRKAILYRIGPEFRALIGPIVERRRRRSQLAQRPTGGDSFSLKKKIEPSSVALPLGKFRRLDLPLAPPPRPRTTPSTLDPALEASLARLMAWRPSREPGIR